MKSHHVLDFNRTFVSFSEHASVSLIAGTVFAAVAVAVVVVVVAFPCRFTSLFGSQNQYQALFMVVFALLLLPLTEQ